MTLIVLVENLVTALDDGNCAVGLFLDFQKAFDTVDHCILLDKLSFYGVRGIADHWFKSYLSNRSEKICVICKKNWHEILGNWRQVIDIDQK